MKPRRTDSGGLIFVNDDDDPIAADRIPELHKPSTGVLLAMIAGVICAAPLAYFVFVTWLGGWK